MLGFTPGTQPVAMKEWVTPLDPSIYAQGVANQTKKLEAQSAQDSELYNSFMNIQAMSPQDEEQLQTLKQSFEKELSGLSMGDLRNPQTKAQLSQIQNKYTNLLLESGIPQRTSSYAKEMSIKKDYEMKNLKYNSPIEAQAIDYIQGGEFYKDTRFNGAGWVSADLQKITKDIRERLKKTVIYTDPTTHRQITEERVDPLEFQNAIFEEMKSNPSLSKDYQYDFEKTHKGVDFSQEGSSRLNNMLLEYTDALKTAGDVVMAKKALGTLTKEDVAEYQLKEANITSRMEQINRAINNPTISGDLVREEMYKTHLTNIAQDIAITNDLFSTTKSELDELYKMNYANSLDISKSRQIELYKLQLKTGILPEKNETQASYIQRLSKASQDKDIEIAKARQDIKTEAAKTMDDYRTANKIEILNTKGEKIAIKDDGAKQFNLNGEAVDKKMLIENVKREDKKTIEKIINSNPEQFGNSSGVDPEGWFDGGVWFTENNGIKYANYEANAIVGGTKYRIPLTDIQKYIADPNHIVTVFSENDNYKAPIKGSPVDNIDKSNATSESTVIYKIGEDGFTIPVDEEAEFLKDNPSAIKQ